MALKLDGLRFGSLVAKERLDHITPRYQWRCVCDCGKEKVVRSSHLKSGIVKSCGCLKGVPDLEKVGRIYGELLVVGVSGEKGVSGRSVLDVKCLRCGELTICGSSSINKTKTCRSCGIKAANDSRRLGNAVNDIGGGLYEVDVSTKKHPDAKTIIEENSLPLIDNHIRWYAREDHGLIYVIRLENRKIKRLHRLISKPGKAEHVDHVNGDTLDNRKSNLRNINPGENQRNMSKSKANTSGVTGVCLDRRSGKWIAQIHGGKPRSFSNFDDAVAHRKKMEKDLGYHQNHGRDKVEH